MSKIEETLTPKQRILMASMGIEAAAEVTVSGAYVPRKQWVRFAEAVRAFRSEIDAKARQAQEGTAE